MENKNWFTPIDLLIIIMIIGILLGLSISNYDKALERARISLQKMNMHNVAIVIETYFIDKRVYGIDFYADNYGSYFYGGDPDADPPVMEKLPTNPWTGAIMTPEEFNPWDYNYAQDVSNDSLGGANDVDGYKPGEMRYGVYIPQGTSEITRWGLIGMDKKGQSIRSSEASDTTGERVIIFVLHN
jgi:type II secretory pathway pseudopilin PulG